MAVTAAAFARVAAAFARVAAAFARVAAAFARVAAAFARVAAAVARVVAVAVPLTAAALVSAISGAAAGARLHSAAPGLVVRRAAPDQRPADPVLGAITVEEHLVALTHKAGRQCPQAGWAHRRRLHRARAAARSFGSRSRRQLAAIGEDLHGDLVGTLHDRRAFRVPVERVVARDVTALKGAVLAAKPVDELATSRPSSGRELRRAMASAAPGSEHHSRLPRTCRGRGHRPPRPSARFRRRSRRAPPGRWSACSSGDLQGELVHARDALVVGHRSVCVAVHLVSVLSSSASSTASSIA